jgi:hypothetical protein
MKPSRNSIPRTHRIDRMMSFMDQVHTLPSKTPDPTLANPEKMWFPYSDETFDQEPVSMERMMDQMMRNEQTDQIQPEFPQIQLRLIYNDTDCSMNQDLTSRGRPTKWRRLLQTLLRPFRLLRDLLRQ